MGGERKGWKERAKDLIKSRLQKRKILPKHYHYNDWGLLLTILMSVFKIPEMNPGDMGANVPLIKWCANVGSLDSWPTRMISFAAKYQSMVPVNGRLLYLLVIYSAYWVASNASFILVGFEFFCLIL
jgi:hypothetical protein